MEPSLARFVTVGNFDDDLKKLAESTGSSKPWSRISTQAGAAAQVEAIRKPGTIITTNTSGLPVGKIAEGFSDDFRRAWFGTHFFNPPRYMRLLELIPTPEADRAAIDAVSHFCDVRLGKGVVLAKDTPNFIGNRIGTFSVLNVMRLMQEMDLTIEEVDALTGQAVGWPKSATFRTIDLVGFDILGHVVGNMTSNVHDERSDLRLPDFFTQMLERKWLGDKTKGGFYKKERHEARKTSAWRSTGRRSNTIRGRSRSFPRSTWRRTSKTPERACARCSASKARPAEGRQSRSVPVVALSDLWTYSANRVPEISDSIVEIDRAMRSASTGSSDRSNSGMPPASKPPSPA
jgi:3-hydroxyacyl-CoA dehydrogenase